MPWVKSNVGPRNIRFGRDALRYMQGSPSPADKTCLENFLRGMQTRPQPATSIKAGNTVWVSTCNHIIIFSKSMKRVIDVRPCPITAYTTP